jgi:hypothetical protein
MVSKQQKVMLTDCLVTTDHRIEKNRLASMTDVIAHIFGFTVYRNISISLIIYIDAIM